MCGLVDSDRRRINLKARMGQCKHCIRALEQVASPSAEGLAGGVYRDMEGETRDAVHV